MPMPDSLAAPLSPSPSGTPAGRVYYPQIDALRFGAFLMVFIHHLPPIDGSALSFYLKRAGNFGVDLFFLLSAFLLFDLLYREHERFGRINISYFFVRRILRIWPLYFFALGVLSACSFLVKGEAPDWPRLAGMALFVENFSAFATGSYAPLFAGFHLWSISLEEQFYLVVPIITALLIELRPRLGFALLALLWVFSIAVRATFIRVGVSNPGVWVMPVARMEPFMIGFAVGLARARCPMPAWLPKAAFALFAAMAVLGYFAAPPPYWYLDAHSKSAVAIVSIALGALFVAVLAGEGLTPYLQKMGAVFLGRISYGLYVWHVLALRLYDRYFAATGADSPADRVSAGAWFLKLAIGLAMTIALAVISYFALERPFLRLKHRFTLVANRLD